MTIFDSEFLENLKNAIVKCNINKSLILKLLEAYTSPSDKLHKLV